VYFELKKQGVESKEFYYLFGFDVLKSVTVKRSTSWDMMPYSPGKAHRRFGRMHYHYFMVVE
jgi:hypothetical protein